LEVNGYGFEELNKGRFNELPIYQWTSLFSWCQRLEIELVKETLLHPKSCLAKGTHGPIRSYAFFLYKAALAGRITIGQTERWIGQLRCRIGSSKGQYNRVFQFRAICIQISCFHERLIARSQSVSQICSPQYGHFPAFRFSSNTSTNCRHSLFGHLTHCPVSVVLSSAIFPTPLDLTCRIYHLVKTEATQKFGFTGLGNTKERTKEKPLTQNTLTGMARGYEGYHAAS